MSSMQDELRAIIRSPFSRLSPATQERLYAIADHMDEQDTKIRMLNKLGGVDSHVDDDLANRVFRLEQIVKSAPTQIQLEELRMNLQSMISQAIHQRR